MKAHEYEREISIKIKQQEKLSQLKVCLLDSQKKPLTGCDSTALIDITQVDQPGNVNFESPIINSAIGDKNIKVTLRREDGASGHLSVAISTSLNLDMVEASFCKEVNQSTDQVSPFTAVD